MTLVGLIISFRRQHPHEYLNQLLLEMTQSGHSDDTVALTQLTKSLHVYPDFHGNRSPVADPTLTGMVR